MFSRFHFLDWLQCLRTREVCNAPIEAGFEHCVPALMAMRAFDTGSAKCTTRGYANSARADWPHRDGSRLSLHHPVSTHIWAFSLGI